MRNAPGPESRRPQAVARDNRLERVTGAKVTTLKAAALKAVSGGTVLRVETDSDGAAYEVHVKKSMART